MKLIDKKILLYKDALAVCLRQKKAGQDVLHDIKFLTYRLKQFKIERKGGKIKC